MKKQPLQQHLSDYYHSQTLREEKLRQLLELTEISDERNGLHEAPQNRRISKSSWWPRGFAIAASFSTVLIVTLYLSNGFSDFTLTERVAQEIALNHHKQLNIEFPGSDYDALRKQMAKLDFSLAPSHRLGDQFTVIGARYCSIQGQLAALLTLQAPDGTTLSLYQTLLNNQLDRLSDNTYTVDGVSITQWQEAGYFYALATDAAQ